MSRRLMQSDSLLTGGATIPGVKPSKKMAELIPVVLQKCRDFGLDFWPTVCQWLDYSEISEVAAYGGFPNRYPHWKWGMEYEGLSVGYEHGMHRIYEMVINCLDPETPVLTTEGTIPAKEVRLGMDVVLGGNLRKVVATTKQQSSILKKIKIKGYFEELVCTGNHKWRILDDLKGPIWKKSNQIVAGDIVIGCDNFDGYLNKPCSLVWNQKIALKNTPNNIIPTVKSISPPTKMNKELAELMGIITGDGSNGVKGSENMVSVSIGLDVEDDYVNFVKGLFYKVFKLEAVVDVKSNIKLVRLCSKEAVSFLDQNGLKKGCTSKNKVIPETILRSSQEFRAAFLRGLFDTDGYSYGISQFGFSAYNKKLASQVQLMLLEMGISTKGSTEFNGVGKDGKSRYINVVELQGRPSIYRYMKRIGFRIQHKINNSISLLKNEYCRGKGLKSPYLQKLCVDWAEENNITTYNNSSLGRSAKRMESQSVGYNCVQSFLERAINFDFEISEDILELTQSPFGVVDSISETEGETVDIALDHHKHDFIASGWITHNTNPCYIYFLNSNTLVDNITVLAHATGHNDFFKNNVRFAPTQSETHNMMNTLANHGTRIRRYMSRWGQERVTEFIDHVMRLETLVDPAQAWVGRKNKDLKLQDKREYYHPHRIEVPKGHDYMEGWMNPPEWKKKENQRIKEKEAIQEIELFQKPTRNILGYLRDNAPLKVWQADIVDMLYDEALYFSPQRITKMLNEGWASYVDFNIMAKQGFVSLGSDKSGSGIVEYADHKAGVLGSKYSLNPYKLGFELLLDIEDRWNKGRFGAEYEECNNMNERKNWDKNLGLGKEKVFEVRKCHDDFTALHEFFTPEFCAEKEFFEWGKRPNGEYVILDKDHKTIKKKMLQKYLNGGLPNIRLVDPNYRGKGIFLLEHVVDSEFESKSLYRPYVSESLASIYKLWKKPVVLSTHNEEGEEFVCVAHGSNADKDVIWKTREQYDNDG